MGHHARTQGSENKHHDNSQAQKSLHPFHFDTPLSEKLAVFAAPLALLLYWFL
jgi:hypothetical protein